MSIRQLCYASQHQWVLQCLPTLRVVAHRPKLTHGRATAAARCQPRNSSSSSSAPEEKPQQQQQQQQQPQHSSKWQALKDMLIQNGPGGFFAYITVSNLLSVTTLSSAWLLFTKRTGTTPLQAWPQFLACYAGVYAAQHLARPYKVAVGLAATPLGTAAVAAAAKLFRTSSRTALVLLLVLEAVVLLACLGCVVLYAHRMVT